MWVSWFPLGFLPPQSSGRAFSGQVARVFLWIRRPSRLLMEWSLLSLWRLSYISTHLILTAQKCNRPTMKVQCTSHSCCLTRHCNRAFIRCMNTCYPSTLLSIVIGLTENNDKTDTMRGSAHVHNTQHA